MLLPLNVTTPVAEITMLLVDERIAAPDPVAIKLLAITLPVAITFVELILTAPAAIIVILPLDVINPADALAEINPFAITLPVTFKLPVTLLTDTFNKLAEILPFAAIEMLSPANVGNNAITLDATLAFV